jgi:hypothetical protein
MADPTLDESELSEADKTHPRLANVTPVGPQQTLIIGAGGQLGRALIKAIPAAVPITRATLDLAMPGVRGGIRLQAIRRRDQRGCIYSSGHF